MTTTLMPLPKQQYFDNAGVPLNGGQVYTYAVGTSTPKATYTDAAGTIQQPNPIVLNSRGEPPSPIYWNGNYKVVVTDSKGNVLYTVDNYNTDPAGLFTSSGSSLIGFLQAGVGAVSRWVQSKLRERVTPEDFGAVGDGVTDDYPAITAMLSTLGTNGKCEFGQGKNYYMGSASSTGLMLNRRGVLVEGNGATLTFPNSFSGDLVRIANSLVKVRNLSAVKTGYPLDANALTGKGFNISSSPTQGVFYCTVEDCYTEGVQHAAFILGDQQGCALHVFRNFRSLNTKYYRTLNATNYSTSYCTATRFYDGGGDPGGLTSNLASTICDNILNDCSFHTTNGHIMVGVNVGANWGIKVRCEGDYNRWEECYWDYHNPAATWDFVFVNSTSQSTQICDNNTVVGGAAIDLNTVQDTTGKRNNFIDFRRGFYVGNPVPDNVHFFRFANVDASGTNAYASIANIANAANGTATVWQSEAKNSSGTLVPISRIISQVEDSTGNVTSKIRLQTRNTSGAVVDVFTVDHDGIARKGKYQGQEVNFAQQSFADNEEWDFPAGFDGVVRASGGADSGFWHVSGGSTTVQLIAGTANCSATSAAGKFCVFANGGKVTVKNRTGAAMKVCAEMLVQGV